MVKIHCDRCGKEIMGTTYYSISIYANDINPTQDNTVSYATAIQNIQTNFTSLFSAEKQYCKECRDDIEYYINNMESKEDTLLRELCEWENLSD